eukprot:1234889-Amphidinium_carterae.1
MIARLRVCIAQDTTPAANSSGSGDSIRAVHDAMTACLSSRRRTDTDTNLRDVDRRHVPADRPPIARARPAPEPCHAAPRPADAAPRRARHPVGLPPGVHDGVRPRE